MYFAYDKDNDQTFTGNSLNDLLKDINENNYDGTDSIPRLLFYKADKIEVKYESKLTLVASKVATKKPTTKAKR